MPKFLLSIAEDEHTGDLGFLVPKMESSFRFSKSNIIYGPSTSSLVITHDLLEHTAFNTVADEIEAAGACYFTRYQSGWVNSYGRNLTIDDFVADWHSLFFAIPNSTIPECKTSLELDDHDIECDLREIVRLGTNYIRREISWQSSEDSDLRDECNNDLALLERNFAHYFRRGYRKAIKRYSGHKAHDVGYLFSSLSDAISKYDPENHIPILVTINNDLTFRVEEYYEEEYE